MSKEVLEQVILKASSDARFRAQLNDNFEAATRPYDLSPEEKSELQKGMAGELADDRTARQTMAASASESVANTASTTASATASATQSASESTTATE
jgi:hypothetical protein